MIRCCQSMFTLTLSWPRSPSSWITNSVIPMFRIRIFIAGSEFLCSSQSSWPASLSVPATSAEPVDEPGPAVRVRRLERVVVALDPGPDDHRHAELARELRARDGDLHRLAAHRRVGVDEPAAPEPRVEVQPAGQAVDVVVGAERVADRVGVLLVQLLRVVELVAVDQVAEPVDRPPHPLDRRLARVLGLVAAGDEAGDHRAERPDAEARLHAAEPTAATASVRVD